MLSKKSLIILFLTVWLYFTGIIFAFTNNEEIGAILLIIDFILIIYFYKIEIIW